jgi:predicted RecA/RadA family phage recombinase
MKSFLQPGEAITLTPPADVKRDNVVSLGTLIGIATSDAPKDGEIEVALTGVYELPKAAGGRRAR